MCVFVCCLFCWIARPNSENITSKRETYGEIVDTIWDGIAAKLDAQCVLAGVFDSVVNAESSVAIVININVHVAASSVILREKEYARELKVNLKK